MDDKMYCGHSRAYLWRDGTCAGLDGAGAVCNVQHDVFPVGTIPGDPIFKGDKGIITKKQIERRYSVARYKIQSDDSGHHYFVEIGMEGQFQDWLLSEDTKDSLYYAMGGYDYDKNRIDGTFSFADPRKY
jgi:hypothetical protein